MSRFFNIKLDIDSKLILFPLIICVYLFMQLPFLSTIRPIMYDESWYANTAYNFSIGNGFINSIVGSGANANFMLPMITGVFFKIFGVSLFIVRLVPVLCGVAFLLILRKIFNLHHINDKSQLIAFLIVLCVPFFNTVFRFGRPESLALVFVLAAIYFYMKFLIEKKYQSISFIAFFLLLAFLSHPFTSLFFLLIGIHLIIIAFRNTDIKLIFHIVLFGVIGFLALFVMLLVNSYYNNHSFDLGLSLNEMFKRATVKVETPELLTDRIYTFVTFWIISTKIIFSLPLIIIVFLGFFISNKRTRILSTISILYIVLSFFIFKNDLEMFPLIFDYFLVISVVILPFVYDYFKQNHIKLIMFLTVLFLVVNLSATISYNIKKQESINTILQSDLKQIIPESSSVFGPIRFWLFAPKTNYISDHYRLKFPNMNTFDYVITNSVDEKIYPNYSYFEKNKGLFSLIYTKESIQYGIVNIYKRQIIR